MANLTATAYCTEIQEGAVDLVYTGAEQPTTHFIYQLLNGGTIVLETTGTGVSVTLNGVPDSPAEGFTAQVLNADNNNVIGDTSGIMVACAPAPDPDPEPLPETPGTATPPAAKYMAVGGVLSNRIEYGFTFQVNDAAGVLKAGHYVEVNIYQGDETTPRATTRARIRNGAAKVDVSRYVQALLSITPPAGAAIIQADAGALVRYHIGFVEVWQGKTMNEVMVGDKHAVNAALQSLVNDFTNHVIKPTL